MTNAAPGSAEQKVGDFYAACMNEPAIEAAGVTPIQPELDRINAISDRASLLAELNHLHTRRLRAALPRRRHERLRRTAR